MWGTGTWKCKEEAVFLNCKSFFAIYTSRIFLWRVVHLPFQLCHMTKMLDMNNFQWKWIYFWPTLGDGGSHNMSAKLGGIIKGPFWHFQLAALGACLILSFTPLGAQAVSPMQMTVLATSSAGCTSISATMSATMSAIVSAIISAYVATPMSATISATLSATI